MKSRQLHRIVMAFLENHHEQKPASASLEQVRAHLLALKQSSEDEAAWAALELRRFEENCRTDALAGNCSVELALLYADVAEALRRWNEAYTVLQALASGSQPDRTDLPLRLAVVCRKAGKIDEASQWLSQCGERTRRRKLYQNEVKRVSVALHRRDCLESAVSAWDCLEREDYTSAIHLMRRACCIFDVGSAGSETLTRVIEAAVDLYRGRALQPYSEDAALISQNLRPRIISVSGFGWSGSGAVADFLRDRPGVSFPFGDTEVSIFEGFENLAIGAAALLDSFHYENPNVRQTASLMILTTFLPALALKKSSKHLNRWPQKVLLRKIDLGIMENYTNLCLRFLHSIDLGIRRKRADAVRNSLNKLLRGVLLLLSDNSDIIVLNNSIHAQNIHLLELLENSIGVVVHRDPRDQFVARSYENLRLTKASVETFAQRLVRNYDKYYQRLQDSTVQARIVETTFERFVSDPDERALLTERLGIKGPSGFSGSLRPEVSQRNIGIYKSFSDQQSIRQLAALLDLKAGGPSYYIR